jgi:xylulokinase
MKGTAMEAYLGIDLGTSGVKAVVISKHGHILGEGTCELSLCIPRPGFAEQKPEEWWQASSSAIKQAVAACPSMPAIGGIGISGQMLGSVLLDERGELTDDCIIWMDQRASYELDEIVKKIGLDRILDATANNPLVSYWAPKLLWLKQHSPQVYSRTHTVLFPKDYLKFRMTGVLDIDVTDATGTMLYNTNKRDWDWPLFDTLDIPRKIVPTHTSESTDVIGYLQPEASRFLGLPAWIPIVGGGGDQMCGAVGLGVVRPGVVSSTIGTSGTVFSFSEKCITDRKSRAALSYCHSVPGSWCMFGCTLGAGGSYKWLRDTFFEDAREKWDLGGKSVYSFMDECAKSAVPGCEGLVFLPYINGERTPYPDPYARGVFFGLSTRHGKNEICRAVMEGVTFSLLDVIEILREYDIPVQEIRAAGGGAKSALWLQMQADIFNANIVSTNIAEAPAVGAAILASVGSGAFPSVAAAADAIVCAVSVTKPQPQYVEVYADYYKTFKALYPVLKPIYAQQAVTVEKWI